VAQPGIKWLYQYSMHFKREERPQICLSHIDDEEIIFNNLRRAMKIMYVADKL
jgi:hypothetical protein